MSNIKFEYNVLRYFLHISILIITKDSSILDFKIHVYMVCTYIKLMKISYLFQSFIQICLGKLPGLEYFLFNVQLLAFFIYQAIYIPVHQCTKH